ncbi:ABC transporter permease [Microlunatus soli]|uniref:ABC-2 type transport system permease protein n=1 Tax=Microlunatus soli TaxID=630515 RepID=A0A1H1PVN1_9ACTN|nr:ABC-2 family transporter protein [Microlunatus soli]SDS15290.1 ABC-2 type transport system permease protein [Microlunatus soli]
MTTTTSTRGTWRRQGRFFSRLIRLNIEVTFAYRGDFMIMQLGNLIIPITSLLVWQAVLATGAALPVTGRYLLAYFVLVAIVEMLASSWTAFFLAESIRNGDLNQWLIRPTSTHLNAVSNNIGEKLVKIIFLTPFVLITMIVLDRVRIGGSGIHYPHDPIRWIAFAVAVLVAAAIRFTLDVLIGSLAFWFEDVQGFLRVSAVVVPVLSGAVVPLALMPAGWSTVTQLQPFRFMLAFPMDVLLSDRIWARPQLVTGFGLQLGWLLIFVAAAVAVWRRGLRSYSAVGA